jgi:molybdate transport system substrate-binding protein
VVCVLDINAGAGTLAGTFHAFVIRMHLKFLYLTSIAFRYLLSVPLVTLVLLNSLVPATASSGEVTVAVAANFTEAARDIATAFSAATDHRARLSFGSTGQLYAQIANGAPFEVFLAADTARPVKAEQNGLAVKGTRFTYASGSLVMWSPMQALFSDGADYLRRGEFKRAAIANPKTAPYGLAAKQVLQRLGLWNSLGPKLVRGNSIAQTFQFVATGNAVIGFVARSQLVSNTGAGNAEIGSVWNIPADYYEPIEQQAVLLSNAGKNKAARSFIAFMKSSAAHEIITRNGYSLPSIKNNLTSDIKN